MRGPTLDHAAGRRSDARLSFARGGGTTVLAEQFTPYPFHVTKLFRLHPERPDLATLYLQSASGGLYRGDRLSLAIEARAGAAAHVTTQSGTVVHDTGALSASQDVNLTIGRGAALAYAPDPVILFPGATLRLATRIVAAPDARGVVVESFACHDPAGAGKVFRRLDLALTIESEAGTTLVREQARLDGEDLWSLRSPLGPYRAYASVTILGAPAALDPGALQAATEIAGCLGGASLLPNGAGLGLRVMAPDGGALSQAIEAAVALAMRALMGVEPGRRRK